MAIFELSELALVVLIIGLQLWFFSNTRKAIKGYRKAIPDAASFHLFDTVLARDDINDIHVDDLLDDLPQYEARARAGGIDSRELIPLKLLKADVETISPVMENIQREIDTYLIRNKSAASDFNLLREIIQRNLDIVEDEINLTTPIPVYLGLIGTMTGIIIGLFALPDISSELFLKGNGIDTLMGGVKIAMGASAVGLILTVITNGWLFKGAKTQVERHKNKFYTFLQTQLMPVLSKSVNSGVISLNRSLDAFGAKFGDDIFALNSLMQRNYESVMAQQVALSALKEMDVSRITQFNVQVLGELRQSLSAIERLGLALEQADTFVDNTRKLVERTEDIFGLTDQVRQVLENAQSLQHYLNSHFRDLEERGSLIQHTVTSLDRFISKEISGLEGHIQERMKAVTEIKINEDAWMQQAMRANQTALSNLSYLEPINEASEVNTSQQRATVESLRQLSVQTDFTNDLLAQLLTEQRNRDWSSRLAKVFGRKTT